jgi:hypothetical protein
MRETHPPLLPNAQSAGQQGGFVPESAQSCLLPTGASLCPFHLRSGTANRTQQIQPSNPVPRPPSAQLSMHGPSAIRIHAPRILPAKGAMRKHATPSPLPSATGASDLMLSSKASSDMTTAEWGRATSVAPGPQSTDRLSILGKSRNRSLRPNTSAIRAIADSLNMIAGSRLRVGRSCVSYKISLPVQSTISPLCG